MSVLIVLISDFLKRISMFDAISDDASAVMRWNWMAAMFSYSMLPSYPKRSILSIILLETRLWPSSGSR